MPDISNKCLSTRLSVSTKFFSFQCKVFNVWGEAEGGGLVWWMGFRWKHVISSCVHAFVHVAKASTAGYQTFIWSFFITDHDALYLHLRFGFIKCRRPNAVCGKSICSLYCQSSSAGFWKAQCVYVMGYMLCTDTLYNDQPLHTYIWELFYLYRCTFWCKIEFF